jgi:hypothetical protein
MEGPIVVAIVFAFPVVLTWIIIRHKEHAAIIEKGLSPEEMKSLYGNLGKAPSPLSSLKWGILLITVGAALMIGLWLRDIQNMDEGFIPGMMALGGGIGLLAFYFFAKKEQPAK